MGTYLLTHCLSIDWIRFLDKIKYVIEKSAHITPSKPDMYISCNVIISVPNLWSVLVDKWDFFVAGVDVISSFPGSVAMVMTGFSELLILL